MTKINGKKPDLSWIELAEKMYQQQYKKDLLKLFEESKPVSLKNFRSGTRIITGTKNQNKDNE
jgi:hypothetical protein